MRILIGLPPAGVLTHEGDGVACEYMPTPGDTTSSIVTISLIRFGLRIIALDRTTRKRRLGAIRGHPVLAVDIGQRPVPGLCALYIGLGPRSVLGVTLVVLPDGVLRRTFPRPCVPAMVLARELVDAAAK